MKLSDVLVIYFTNIILRATSAYVPVVRGYNDNHSSLFLLAGFLTFLLLSLRKRKPVTAATSKTSTASTTSTTSTASTTSKTSTASTTSKTSTASTTSTTNTTVKPLICRVRYTLYDGPGRSFCYRLSSDCKTWADAQAVCRMEGSDLTSPDEMSLQPFAEVLKGKFPATAGCRFHGNIWLGATTNGTQVAVYTDGRIIPSNSLLWAFLEPSKPGDCIVLGFNPKQLFDTSCSFTLPSVCQQS